MINKNFEEDLKFIPQTCEALLLQFKKPIVYDLSIPSAYNICSLVVIAGKIMSGEEINPAEVNCITTSHSYWENRLKEEYFSKLSPKVSKGLMKVLDEPRDDSSLLEKYLGWTSSIFGHEWHHGKGDWYRFREGKREETEKKVRAYFSDSELADFDKIGNLFQPYIGLTSSECRLK